MNVFVLTNGNCLILCIVLYELIKIASYCACFWCELIEIISTYFQVRAIFTGSREKDNDTNIEDNAHLHYFSLITGHGGTGNTQCDHGINADDLSPDEEKEKQLEEEVQYSKVKQGNAD